MVERNFLLRYPLQHIIYELVQVVAPHVLVKPLLTLQHVLEQVIRLVRIGEHDG